MKSIAVLISSLIVSASFGDQEQHATATWLRAEEPARSDGTIRTVIIMKVDKGWHTYWKNPGEGGLPPTFEAELPKGWKVGEIQYPVPKRFMTGELPGFGYEGEVLFPVVLTPPKNFDGEIQALSASFSWLTCTDQACLPGEAELQLSATADAELIEGAFHAIPRPLADARLEILSGEDFIQMSLILPEDSELDPSGFAVFPASPDIIDLAAKPSFRKNPTTPGTWIAAAPKSEYLSGTPGKLTLVLQSKDGNSYEITSK